MCIYNLAKLKEKLDKFRLLVKEHQSFNFWPSFSILEGGSVAYKVHEGWSVEESYGLVDSTASIFSSL